MGLNWDEAWLSVWYEPKDICFDITGDQGSGACGFNSFCLLDSYGRPSCECLLRVTSMVSASKIKYKAAARRVEA